MSQPVILSACRTAIATAGRGSLRDTTAFELAPLIVTEAVRRSGLPVDVFDDVILGEVLAGGGVIARHAAVEAGLTDVPGVALNRHCASGLSSIAMAAGSIAAGMDRAIVAGGVQSSSTSPVSKRRKPGTDDEWEDPWMSPSHLSTPDAPNVDMSVTVGWSAAKSAQISREEADAWALRSHQRAIRAIDEGQFVDEIVPVKVTARDGSVSIFEVDEHPRRSSTPEALAKLKPLHPEIEGFNVTAGNASGVNDAASAVVVSSAELAVEHGITPLATILGWASVGVDPALTGTAPVSAIKKLLDRTNLTLADVDLWEINEAFATVAVATTKMLEIDPELVNVQGSGCSLGHPVAATGARMITSLINELRRRGGGIAVASMCAGGGMGSAMAIKVEA